MVSQIVGLSATSAFAGARSTIVLWRAITWNNRRVNYLKMTVC